LAVSGRILPFLLVMLKSQPNRPGPASADLAIYVSFHDFTLINFCGITNSFLCFNEFLPKFLEFFDKKWKKTLVEERKFLKN
jgi:hypothetical protein